MHKWGVCALFCYVYKNRETHSHTACFLFFFLYNSINVLHISKKYSTFAENLEFYCMKIKRLIPLLLLCWCAQPLLAQSIILTKEFQTMPNIKALDAYRNQFGTWEKPEADDPFPYAVIRVGLDGTPEEVKDAKRRLSFHLGRMTTIEAVFKDARNELLFLVPTRARNIQMSCDGECLPQMMFDSLVVLQPNTVFYGRVHFSLEENLRDPEKLKQYLYTLAVEPVHAKVELRYGFVNQEWELKDGKTEQLLTEGTYYYTISAEDYKTAEGSFVVDSLHSDTTIALTARFGRLSVKSDSTALDGLAVSIVHDNQQQILEMPVVNQQCALGQHVLQIKKPKYHTWKQKVIIHPGEHLEVSPVLQRKEYKHHTFILLEGGYAMNPAWSAGVMLGQVYGEVTQVCGIGWYVKGRSNFQTTKAIRGVRISDIGTVGVTNPLMPAYTGNRRFSEWNVNAGVVIDFLNDRKLNLHKHSMFGLYAGLGYGQYARYWEIEDGRWITYGPSAANGLSVGGGVIGSVKGLTISAGVNTIMAKYMEIEAGLGWTF